MVGKDEHVRRETDALGAGREVPEGGERIPVHRPTAVELGSRQRDVLAAREVVVAETVGGLGDPGQILDRSVVGPLGAGRHDGRPDRQSNGCGAHLADPTLFHYSTSKSM